VGSMRCLVSDARDADPASIVQQQIPAMLRRVDPLIEGLFETVVAIGNILSRAPGAGRRDPRAERPQHFMTERVFGGHRLGLLKSDPVERRIAGDTPFAMLHPEI